MTKSDAIGAVRQMGEPSTKAAQLRQVMPEIERKLAEGVQLRTIHKALTGAGFELTFQTLRTYLYRYRKKHQAGIVGRATESVDSRSAATSASSQLDESGSYETERPETPMSRGPISMQELDRLMKPDPAEQARDITRYERLAKQKWRKR